MKQSYKIQQHINFTFTSQKIHTPHSSSEKFILKPMLQFRHLGSFRVHETARNVSLSRILPLGQPRKLVWPIPRGEDRLASCTYTYTRTHVYAHRESAIEPAYIFPQLSLSFSSRGAYTSARLTVKANAPPLWPLGSRCEYGSFRSDSVRGCSERSFTLKM